MWISTFLFWFNQLMKWFMFIMFHENSNIWITTEIIKRKHLKTNNRVRVNLLGIPISRDINLDSTNAELPEQKLPLAAKQRLSLLSSIKETTPNPPRLISLMISESWRCIKRDLILNFFLLLNLIVFVKIRIYDS